MKTLPISYYEQQIIETIKDNQVTILVGHTGSGKSTQVPLYLLDLILSNSYMDRTGNVAVTQPRRIAAISLAEYVANWFGCNLGEEIGYKIRFEDLTDPEGTLIQFQTDGILLQKAKADPNFSDYDIIIIDEAHERTTNIDFLLGLLKEALKRRSDLKVVVMSATIDSKKFSDFFNGAPVLNVEGSMYDVDITYIKERDIDEALAKFKVGYEFVIEALAALMVDRIHRQSLPGDIGIIMPRQKEIFKTIELIQMLGHSDLVILPAYGEMDPSQQHKIFDSYEGQRKVIVGTNLLETSITVDGLVYMIDSGLINQTAYNPKTGIGSLKVREHSLAGLNQRAGRVGRTQEGVCIRLFEESELKTGRRQYLDWHQESRPDFTPPEILRSDLAGTVLHMIGVGIRNIETFEFVDMPPTQNLHDAINTLLALDAIDLEGNLTEIGKRLLKLPLEPRMGRMILAAIDYGCVEEICTIAASLSVQGVFIRPKDYEEQEKARIAKSCFIDPRSDFLTTLNAVYGFLARNEDHGWARRNYLHAKKLCEILNIRDQLLDILEDHNIEISSIGYTKPTDPEFMTDQQRLQGDLIGKAITSGLIQNLALRGMYHTFTRKDYQIVYIFPGSVLFDRSAIIITCHEVVDTSKPYARNCQEVKLDWVKELAPSLVHQETRREYDYAAGGYVDFVYTYIWNNPVAKTRAPSQNGSYSHQLTASRY